MIAPRKASEPARVALVVPNLQDGGLQRVVKDLALSLERRRFTPAVFCMRALGPYADDLRAAGVPVWNCVEPKVRIRGLPGRLLARLAEYRPSIIHAHSGTWLPAAVVKTVLRYPRLMFTDHGRYPPEPRLQAIIERWCYGRTDRSVGVSSAAASYVQEFLGLRQPLTVIPNGVDLAGYRQNREEARARLRTAWGVGTDDVLAISIGRLVPVKNHGGLLRALARALPDAPKLRLAILGAGELEAELREEARALELTEHVHFLGYRADIPECLHAADLFVMPSTTEGLPIALLEAMAAGVPVLATRVGGIPEVLGAPPAGCLIAPGDPEELTRALARLAADPPLRERLSELGLERVQRFSLQACAARYHDMYETLLTGAAAC